MRKLYKATVQILIAAENQDDAADGIHALLENSVADSSISEWGYVKGSNGLYLYPEECARLESNPPAEDPEEFPDGEFDNGLHWQGSAYPEDD